MDIYIKKISQSCQSSTLLEAQKAVVTMSRYSHKMLPPCDGPKLHPFSKSRAVDVEFVRLLSDEWQEGQSHVFEVVIDGMRYALKMVGGNKNLAPCSYLLGTLG